MKRTYLPVAALLLSVAVLTAGCIKKPLETEPVSQSTPQTFWRNQTDVLAGVAGIYNVLFEEDGVGHGNWIFDNQSDDISTDGDHDDYKAIERFDARSDWYQVRTTWNLAYEEIARANNAIIYVPKVPVIDEAIRTRSMGEAYFLRAYGYWVLNNIYGEVPLIQEENVLAGTYNIPKNTLEEVRTFIESDLLKAADMLPETYGDDDKGRVSKGAAWGMLCKLYMTWEKLDKAVEYGQKVISNPNYALANKYADNFTVGSQNNNTELLFAIWNKRQAPTSPASIYFSIREWYGWGFHHPSQNFADEFESSDTQRKQTTLLSVGDSIPYQNLLAQISAADTFQMYAGKLDQFTGKMLPSQSTTGYCIRKFTAYDPTNPGLDGDLKFPLLRTADIYLLVAEAKVRQQGAGAGDAEIAAVRRRSGLADASGATFKDVVHERRVELGGENVRWFDLVRWDKVQLINLDTIVSKPKLASLLPPYKSAVIVPGRTFTRPKNYYIPIPQTVIDQSKGVITQNPNY